MSRSSRRRAARAGSSPSGHPDAGATTAPWYTRIPIAPSVLTAVILVSAIFAVPPIRDVVTLEPTPDAVLRLPVSYILLAPISAVLDTLTLLAVPQHIAIGVWLIGGYIWWRVQRARAGRATGLFAELTGAAALLGGLVVTYGSAAYLPRSMARLDVLPTDVYAVDFHMHTRYSHDGRRAWSPARARAWVRDAGYDAAYITDHRTYEGAEAALQGNPSTAASGPLLLQGIEGYYNGEHVNVLSAGRRYRNVMTPDLGDVDVQGLMLMSTLNNAEPVLIETLAGNLDKIVPAPRPGMPGMRAIELIDGSPRGLTQTRRERARIIRISDSLRMTRVTGSDNHGYGRTAPGWTLMRAENWKTLSADSLSKVIEHTIRLAGPEGTSVIERRIAGGTNVFTAALTPVLVPWRMFTTLSLEERVLWLVWTWGLTLAVRWRPGRESDAVE